MFVHVLTVAIDLGIGVGLGALGYAVYLWLAMGARAAFRGVANRRSRR